MAVPGNFESAAAVSERYYDELLRYFMHVTRDLHESQDLVQEVFERVLAMEREGKEIQEMRALLYQTARNLLVDRFRFQSVRNHVSDDELRELAAPRADQPDEAYARSQRSKFLIATIEALPPRCREAFVMNKIEGIGQALVAEQMGVSRNMVERHIMTAIAICRKAMDQHQRAEQLTRPDQTLDADPGP